MKIKISISAMLVVLASSPAIAQDSNFGYLGKHFKHVIAFEKQNNSTIYEVEGDLIVPGGMAIPVTYLRPDKTYSKVSVEYLLGRKIP